MIAKLVTRGETREAATARMREALDAFHIRGVSHNLGFLAAVLGRERFRRGALSTDFIAEEFPGGFAAAGFSETETEDAVAVVAAVQRLLAEREAQISGQMPGHGARPGTDWVVVLDETHHAVRVEPMETGYRVIAEGAARQVGLRWRPGEAILRAVVDGRALTMQIEREGVVYRLSAGGKSALLRVLTPQAAALLAHMPVKQAADLSRLLLSPMPGLLVGIAVAEGQEVKAGDQLATVEAMKMENVLRAERDGTVAKIRVKPGDSLAVDDIILEFA
jgi:propionyl-CoA carboxylase alpha chain